VSNIRFEIEAVRGLQELPPEILLVPLFGHTLGHCGVAVQDGEGWMLHAGDAYFDPREINGPTRRCAFMVGLFQAIVQTNRGMRLHNQDRLRSLRARHPEIKVFSAHNPFEIPFARPAGAGAASPGGELAVVAARPA